MYLDLRVSPHPALQVAQFARRLYPHNYIPHFTLTGLLFTPEDKAIPRKISRSSCQCRLEMDPAQSGDQQHNAAPGITDDPSTNGNSAGKKRWRRNRIACDSCHTRRVRCDRAFPCSRCLRNEIRCEFTRELRKRGRIARSKQTEVNPSKRTNTTIATTASPVRERNESPPASARQRSPATNDVTVASAASVDGRRVPGPEANATEDWLSATHVSSDSYGLVNGTNWRDGSLPRMLDFWNGIDFAGYNAQTPPASKLAPMAQTPGSSSTATTLKYPVLQPLMPFLETTLSRRLVFDLLELYFTSAFSTHMHPVCHHIHCYVLRKASFLTSDSPRPTSPALLASMLWVAALDDRAFALSISPLQRKKICQFLCALTIRLLRPLIHASFREHDSSAPRDVPYAAAGPECPPLATMHHPSTGTGDDRGLVGPAGSLDDVITYIHVASIISSSEQKAASMRWLVLRDLPM